MINAAGTTHTGFLGVDHEAFAGRPKSCRVVAPNLDQVVGVGLHTLQPGTGVSVGCGHSLRPSLTLIVIPPELHLRRTITEIFFFFFRVQFVIEHDEGSR